jgi:hypothetical protein
MKKTITHKPKSKRYKVKSWKQKHKVGRRNYKLGPILWSAEDIGKLKTKKGDVRVLIGSRRVEDAVRGWDRGRTVELDEKELKEDLKYRQKQIKGETHYPDMIKKFIKDDTAALQHMPERLAAAKARTRQKFREEKYEKWRKGDGDMVDLGEFLYQAERRKQPGMWDKIESDAFLKAVQNVGERTKYGRRKVRLEDDAFVASWSNAAESWGLHSTKHKKGDILDLDANEIIIPTEHEMTARKIVPSLPELPLFGFSTEAKERGKDHFTALVKTKGPETAKAAEMKFYEGRIALGMMSTADIPDIKKMLDKKYKRFGI